MNRVLQVIREMHRRSIWQVLGIYLVGSWLGYQVILGLTDGLGLPNWVPGLAVVLFLVGLPVVLATAFVQEGLPRGAGSTLDPTLFPEHDVVAATRAAGDADVATAGSRLQRLMTWRRSMGAGVIAFACLALVTTGFLSTRALGIGPAASLLAAGVITEAERVVITDFESVGGDTTLARLVTEAFRVDFARSTLVRPVDPTAVREVLRLMGRTDLPRLDAELGREIALRDGVHLVITGEITSAAGTHVLTARLMSAETGEVLAAHRETARGDDQLIGAIDKLSRALRERTGESLRTLRRTEPLAQVTTPSLEALRKFTDARRAAGWQADPGRSRQLLEEAVALDSGFAAAHLALATNYSNAYNPERALAAAAAAERFQERLSAADRIRLRAQVHNIRNEYSAAAAAWEQHVALTPNSVMALNNLAMAYVGMQDYERALQYFERAARADSTRPLPYANVGEALVMLGRIEEGQRAFQRAAAIAPSPWSVVGAAAAPYAAGDWAAGDSALRALMNDPATPRNTVLRATRFLSASLEVRGQLAEASRLANAAASAQGSAQAERQAMQSRFWAEVWIHQRPERARALLPELLRVLHPTQPQDSVWAFLESSLACGMVGDVACARSYLTRAGRDGELPPWAEIDALLAQGALAFAEGNHAVALRRFRAATDGRSCPSCEQMLVGRVFEEMGQPDSAIVAYERYLGAPSVDRILWDQPRGATIERLARLYEQRGDRTRALHTWAALLDLWDRADAELQPRVAEARRRVMILQPDR
jgi:eukaryotic-like serine/threonine-protein kinase